MEGFAPSTFDQHDKGNGTMANIELQLTPISVLRALTDCSEEKLLSIIQELGMDVYYWNGIPSIHDDNVKPIIDHCRHAGRIRGT